jgi:hypothetical protein
MVMPELPAWAQETSERADRATKGPWYLVNCDDRDFASMLRVTTAPDSERPEDTVAIVLLQMPLEACVADERWDENAEFIVHARTDVPRLIELVGEMAEALESVVCVFDAMNDVELSLHVGMEAARAQRAARQVLAKYRGEEDKP